MILIRLAEADRRMHDRGSHEPPDPPIESVAKKRLGSEPLTGLSISSFLDQLQDFTALSRVLNFGKSS